MSYADQWLGFSEVQLHQWLEEAGFGKLEVRVASREKESPHFQTVFATGRKSALCSRLGQRQNRQQRGPLQYFNSLLDLGR